MVERLKGLVALLALVAILAGIPAVLIALAARPGFFPAWERWQTALLSPDDGRIVLVIIWAVGWVLWLVMAWLLLRELAAAMRGLQTPALPRLGLPQHLARDLVAATLLLFIATPAPLNANAEPPTGPQPTPPTTTVAATSTATIVEPAAAPAKEEPARIVQVVVGPGDTLWGYAETYLGAGERWPEIFEVNKGVRQADGRSLQDPDLIVDGWHLNIPVPPTAGVRSPGDGARTPGVASANTAEGETVEVVVGPGDTLWGYAETYLGAGERWPEIFHANKGVRQPDGRSLQDPDLIVDGWKLTITLPAATPTTPPAQTTPTQPAPTTEEPNAPEVTEPTTPAEPTKPEPSDDRDTGQPSPTAATATPVPTTDTTPGTTTPAMTGPAVVPAPSPPTPTATTAPPAISSPTPAAEGAAPAENPSREDGDAASAWQVAGLLGAGLLLGAGVWALLLRRRRWQFRTRQPGTAIPAPDPVVAPIEQTAALAADLSRDQINRIDHTLRELAADGNAPNIEAVGISRDGTLTIRTETELPEPWHHTTAGWQLPANTRTQDRPEQAASGGPVPYPMLASIGADPGGTIWLLNLDAHESLHIGGDAVMRDDFLRYLTAELATTPWATDVRIADNGSITSETSAMAPERFTTPADLAVLAETNRDRALRAGCDATAGRRLQLEDEAWPALILITDKPGPLHRLIADHPRRTGATILQTGPGPADLTLTAAGRIHGLGFDLTATGLTADEAAGCAALLNAANQDTDQEPVPALDDVCDQTGNLLPEATLDRDDPAGAESILPAPDTAYQTAAAVTERDLQLLAPRPTEQTRNEILRRDPGLDRDVEAWFSPKCPWPRLTWLGPVRARCHGTPPAKSRAYYTEVLSYLAAHPAGVTNDQLADAFNITSERARTVISNLRRWLGTNPATRLPHIPDAKNNPRALEQGIGLYLVENLLSDADLFRRLRTRAQAAGPDGIQDLETALRLVAGRPFDQLRPTGWNWLYETDRIDHHMTCAIADVAHTLVVHHLQQGNLLAARDAAQTSLTACPESETATLDLATIMVTEGNTAAADQLINQALNSDDDDDPADPADPSPRTAEILRNRRLLKTA